MYDHSKLLLAAFFVLGVSAAHAGDNPIRLSRGPNTGKTTPLQQLASSIQVAQSRYDRCDSGYHMCTIYTTAPQSWCCPYNSRCGRWYGTCGQQ